MKINLFRCSLKTTFFSLSMLALFWSVDVVAVQAQSQEIFRSIQKTQSSDNPQLKMIRKKAEEFVRQLQNRNFFKIRDSLSPDLQREWPTMEIEYVWDELLVETGSFKQLVDLYIAETINSDLVLLTLEFESGNQDLLLTFSKNGQIIGVNLPETKSIDKIAEEFIDYIVAEDYAKARGYLHPFLKAEIFPEQVKEKWQELTKSTGSFQKRTNTRVRKGSNVDDTDLVLVTVKFAKVTEDVLVIFDDYKRIVGVDITQNRFQ